MLYFSLKTPIMCVGLKASIYQRCMNAKLLTLIYNRSLSLSVTAEWSVFVLKVLSELSLVLLVQDDENEEKIEEERDTRDTGGAAETSGEGRSSNQVLSVFTKYLLSRLVSFPSLCLTIAADLPRCSDYKQLLSSHALDPAAYTKIFLIYRFYFLKVSGGHYRKHKSETDMGKDYPQK